MPYRLTVHNVHHLLALMRDARSAILADQYPDFVKNFFAKYFGSKGAPEWAVSALERVGIALS